MAWLFCSIFTILLIVATFVYIFFEIPVATLWSYVMIAIVGNNNRKLETEVKSDKKIVPEEKSGESQEPKTTEGENTDKNNEDIEKTNL